MAINNRGLGKGIDALFESAPTAAAMPETPLRSVPLDAITSSPDQPREIFREEALADLAASIKNFGVLEPLLVRQGEAPGSYRLIAGERRLRAARMAGLAEVPVILRNLDDRESLIITLLENLQREDLNPIEEARGIESLRVALNLTLDAIAETLGKARSTISHSLRLLKLPEAIQQEVAEGHISASHAKTIASLPDEEAILRLGKRIIEEGMTARETEAAVASFHESGRFDWEEAPAPKRASAKPEPDPAIGRLADSIGGLLNCRARIRGNQDKGKISLAYETNEQLYELLERLGLTLDNLRG